MKVLHINTHDIQGGAAIAAYRLHEGLIRAGVDSKLLVGIAKVSSPQVAEIKRDARWEWRLWKLSRIIGLNYTHITSTFNIQNHPFYQEADIIHFHNLHGDYFNYLAIPKLTQKKPTVWTLHDMWSLTGHCAYSFDCERWKSGCGKCPYPQAYPDIGRDSTKLEWKLKRWIYEHSNLTIVCPSKWLYEQAKASILGRFEIHHIPNGVDLDIFRPLEKELCKSLLNLDLKKKVLLFAAENLNDIRKGADLLNKALERLPESLKEEVILLTFGRTKNKLSTLHGIPIFELGFIESDYIKAIVYSAADLFLFPTRADNLPLVLQESMACGTPMISFDVGGVSDIISNNEIGVLTPKEDYEKFTENIVKTIEDKVTQELYFKSCRKYAERKFNIIQQVKTMKKLYNSLHS